VSTITKRKPKFEVGNQVHVRAGSHVLYEITRLMPDGRCLIREWGTAPNGKPYREQRWDTSMLEHAVTDEMLEAFSFGGLKAGR
jgi:hypothetical protein